MKKTIFAFAFLILTTAFFTSCTKDNVDSATEVDNYVNEIVQNLEATTRTGRGGCFELVFPVTIGFPTDKTVEVNSYEELKAAIKAWRKENGKPGSVLVKPHFVYPIDLITKEGETVTVNSLLELIGLRKDCVSKGNGQGKPCFKLNYPLTVLYPDNSTATYVSPVEMRKELREWKKNNADAIYRPVLTYPITITMEDGSIVTINSREELRAAKEGCK
jgi:hypothetical protein